MQASNGVRQDSLRLKIEVVGMRLKIDGGH